MSQKHPIISITGSSGAGTSTVRDTLRKSSFERKSLRPSSRGTPFIGLIALK